MATPQVAKDGAIKRKKFSLIKNSEEKRFMIEDAVRTFERAAEIKREIKEIKADKELFEATKAVLKQKIADTKTAMKG